MGMSTQFAGSYIRSEKDARAGEVAPTHLPVQCFHSIKVCAAGQESFGDVELAMLHGEEQGRTATEPCVVPSIHIGMVVHEKLYS